jgi:ferredoxin
MNSIALIEPAERPYRQIGDPAKCVGCGTRAKSAFEIYDPAGWVFRLGECGRPACAEQAREIRSRVGPLQRLVDPLTEP